MPSTEGDSPPDIHRAIDHLTALRLRLQHLHERAAAGEPVDPAVFRELDALADYLTGVLIHCRDAHGDRERRPGH